LKKWKPLTVHKILIEFFLNISRVVQGHECTFSFFGGGGGTDVVSCFHEHKLTITLKFTSLDVFFYSKALSFLFAFFFGERSG
jgi:hypothetical protein